MDAAHTMDSTLRVNPDLQRNQRAGKPRLGPVKKHAHAQGFSPLRGHQPQMAFQVIAILQPHRRGLIGISIALQAFNAVNQRLPEPRADFKTPQVGMASGVMRRWMVQKIHGFVLK